jgi:hypothetical protein
MILLMLAAMTAPVESDQVLVDRAKSYLQAYTTTVNSLASRGISCHEDILGGTGFRYPRISCKKSLTPTDQPWEEEGEWRIYTRR